MEDISKELEKEFAQTRPKPYKRTKDTRVLIIDDFGLVKSGQYLKSIIRILFVLSLVFLAGTILFLFLYIGVLSSAGKAKKELKLSEKKVAGLVQEKEMLMARLVIEGKKPGIGDRGADKTKMSSEVSPGLTGKWAEGSDSDQTVLDKKNKVQQIDNGKSIDAATPDNTISKMVSSGKKTNTPGGPSPSATVSNQLINVEKFTVKKDQINGDLLVRFDIRNVSGEPGDVSGRIFTVLKPDMQNRASWLVVPSSTLDQGIPSEPKRGQYFSIAHFKPMKFRVKTSTDPDHYKVASIYVFNDDGNMIAESMIDITDAE